MIESREKLVIDDARRGLHPRARCPASLADMPAGHMADAIQQAVLAFSGWAISDDTVVLVLKVP